MIRRKVTVLQAYWRHSTVLCLKTKAAENWLPATFSMHYLEKSVRFIKAPYGIGSGNLKGLLWSHARDKIDYFTVSLHGSNGTQFVCRGAWALGLCKATVSGFEKRWKFPPVTWSHKALWFSLDSVRVRRSQFILELTNHPLANWWPCLIP